MSLRYLGKKLVDFITVRNAITNETDTVPSSKVVYDLDQIINDNNLLAKKIFNGKNVKIYGNVISENYPLAYFNLPLSCHPDNIILLKCTIDGAVDITMENVVVDTIGDGVVTIKSETFRTHQGKTCHIIATLNWN